MQKSGKTAVSALAGLRTCFLLPNHQLHSHHHLLAQLSALPNSLSRSRIMSKRSSTTSSSNNTGNSYPTSPKKVNIDKNIELRRLYSSSTKTNLTTKSDKIEEDDNDHKKLAIIFAYMLPKEKHLDKYRSIYFNQGFDVITVKTSPFEFFFPLIGAQKIAHNLLSNLINSPSLSRYDNIIVHGFSVGGYQFSEFLKQIQKIPKLESNNQDEKKIKDVNKDKKDDGDDKIDKVRSAIKGTIFDSPCDVDSVPYGFSRTVAGDTLLAKIIEIAMIITRSIFHPISTRYHRLGYEFFRDHPLNVPSLFLASKQDNMADINVIQSVVNQWREKGIDVNIKTWNDTRHVSHFHAHPKEYTSHVEDFVSKVVSK